MTAPRFHNASGTLTPYAFACGYVERAEYGAMRYTVTMAGTPFERPAARITVTLARDGACWRVTLYDFGTGERLTLAETRLTAARRAYARMRTRAKLAAARPLSWSR